MNLHLILYTKISWIVDLNVKGNTLQVLVDKYLYNLGVGKDFLNEDTKHVNNQREK